MIISFPEQIYNVVNEYHTKLISKVQEEFKETSKKNIHEVLENLELINTFDKSARIDILDNLVS
jgi:predicted house-cleaning noncanonical NTP pyrophosphatase (MazG superfamily)